MANTLLSSFNFNEYQGICCSYKECKKEEMITKVNKTPSLGEEDCGRTDLLASAYGLFQENIADKAAHLYEDQQHNRLHHHHHQHNNSSMPLPVESIYKTLKLENVQNLVSEPGESMKDKSDPFCLSSLMELHGEDSIGFKKSAEEIVRIAGERFIEFSTKKFNGYTMLIHPYGSAPSGLSMEETADVELVHHLLAAAEKITFKLFDQANGLLARCKWMASESGNPIQRVVFYFAEALRERICKEAGIGKFSAKTQSVTEQVKLERDLPLGTNLTFLACHQKLPFSQVTQFAGIQAIIENVSMASKIHLIDLQIRSGIQWTVLMQALAERGVFRIKHLKITALGTKDKQQLEATGNRLQKFAESLNLSFSFKAVVLEDMKDLIGELLEIEADEALAVYAATVFRTMLSRPESLETVMRVIKGLRPSVMVVTEVEANHNSPSFVNRFIEALFFYSAYFDCLEDCMDRNSQYRLELEGVHFFLGIRNIVAAEGEERYTRSVKMEVWRAFFTRFGIVEVELSESSLYQAKLVLKRFACGSSCTFTSNGKCLLVGWKGTPIHSLSVWKFL